MDSRRDQQETAATASSEQFSVAAPAIELPKGGGAIKGIGEKFAANPVTGTGSMSIPIATSPGRGGFGPELVLSYDSGTGNGIFGFGWDLAMPAITRKTEKGLPRYQDEIASDVFILSGSEDLVPKTKGDGSPEILSSADNAYNIQRFRPRIEGLFARIERWTKKEDGETHWRTISRDNLLTIYGLSENSRIADPENPQHVFSWLICETRDDKGNAIVYEYKRDDGINADLGQVHERNRGGVNDVRRSANRYLKRIKYGNVETLLDGERRPLFLAANAFETTNWMFEVVFDFGEHGAASPRPQDQGDWRFRADAFSSYRSGFELRTTRLCQRVLMFHHFPGETGVGANCLVRSTDFVYSHQNPIELGKDPSIYTFLLKASQTGYKRRNGQLDTGYLTRSMPPVEFEYSEPKVQDSIEVVDSENLQNLPAGVDGATYRWADLHGEGVPGILTEQGNAWWYKRNLSPFDGNSAKFSPLEKVEIRPNLPLAAGAQFMDLDGDGQTDLVMLDDPTPGHYAHDAEEGWHSFVPFESRVNRNFQDPNLRMLDLDGDGHADVLITEDEAFIWHASLEDAGYGPAKRVAQALDEEAGPRLVFADRTQSIFLADMSGDGLTDLVRIRNSEICYWPNLGYCRFGAKITMSNTPTFDHPDQFEHSRLRIADIDGSGTNDIIYLHTDGVRLYFNQSGNGWSDAQLLNIHPRIDEITAIAPADLLGNGTACLVWSTPLPGDAGRQMRYVNLMGEQKPHLLIKMKNNLGATTEIEYVPSTHFYLADKLAGNPWVTKLPFPVHVVTKIIAKDKWRATRFATTYSYHHGYFDGEEREFRGFGRVEQIDVESFGEFEKGNEDSPYITSDKTLYQPPIKTVTWFNTGMARNRVGVLEHFQNEFFGIPGGFTEKRLVDRIDGASQFNGTEWREAMRACKGVPLRREVFELDVDALELGQHIPTRLFSTEYHNCNVSRLQEQSDNRHAVFLLTESEAITYQYELILKDAAPAPDPRISHTLNLNFDEYGNVVQSVQIGYPRVGAHTDATLPSSTESLIADVQGEMHLSYVETRFTDDVDDPTKFGDYRLRLPCEAMTHEVTGLSPASDYFELEELQALRLSDFYQAVGIEPDEISYHQFPDHASLQKRIVEHARMLFFDTNLVDLLPFRELNHLALPFENYKLALTDGLLTAVYGDKITNDVQAALDDADVSGYLTGPELATRFVDGAGQYWVRSGIAGFANDAAEHFFLPEKYFDSFDEKTTLKYDIRDLFIESSTDPLSNTVDVMKFDYRVLSPSEMRDINKNLTAVVFDVLGMPTAVAVRGTAAQADSLEGFDDALVNPPFSDIIDFFDTDFVEQKARDFLDKASARHIYDFGERIMGGVTIYEQNPPSAAGITREIHVAEPNGATSPLQVAVEYSDGSGELLVTKNQAEPLVDGGPLQWIANGLTVLNNKGNPVIEFEPYFTGKHIFEPTEKRGAATVTYYDSADRPIRVELPDGTWSRVEFSPWHVTRYDANDTVLELGNEWHATNMQAGASNEQKRAAALAEVHADTPATVHLDSLGREVISVEHNRFQRTGEAPVDEKYVTYTKLDAEGKPLWIRDARGNLVIQYITPLKPVRAADEVDPQNPEVVSVGTVPCYSISGEALYQSSMDGGDRWLLNDATGQPFFAWDENENEISVLEQRRYRTIYDKLRRPIQIRLKINGGAANVIERLTYGEGVNDDMVRNLRGRLHQQYDSSGLITSEQFDFKGNPLEVTRQLASDFSASIIDWPETPPANSLDEVYIQKTTYNALDRMTRHENWHIVGRQPAVYEPKYNERGLLKSEKLTVSGQMTEAILNIEHDEKGQRIRIQYGNGTTTRYLYDQETFRLTQLRTTRTSPGEGLPTGLSNLSDLNVLQNLYYHYDPVGNITEIMDDAYEPVFFKNQQVEPRSLYRYDSLYRLIEASGRESASANAPTNQFQISIGIPQFPITDQALRNYREHYFYDSAGNIEKIRHVAQQANWTRNCHYAGDSNRLLRTSFGTNETNPVDYEYDTHGSMQNLNRAPDEFRLNWNYDDMIRQINLGGGGTAFYQYASDKERCRKRIVRIGNTVEERIYLDGMERYRRFVSGNVIEEIETHHLFDGDERVLIVEEVLSTNNVNLDVGILFRYQYTNHLGSASLELTANANTISYEEYHPYGTAAFSAANSNIRAVAKRYRYIGVERDAESGLHYHSARYSLTWLGRWSSVDPAGLADGHNLYSYGRNNPIQFIDVNGTDSKKAERIKKKLAEAAFREADLQNKVDDLVGLKDKLESGIESLEKEFNKTFNDINSLQPEHESFERKNRKFQKKLRRTSNRLQRDSGKLVSTLKELPNARKSLTKETGKLKRLRKKGVGAGFDVEQINSIEAGGRDRSLLKRFGKKLAKLGPLGTAIGVFTAISLLAQGKPMAAIKEFVSNLPFIGTALDVIDIGKSVWGFFSGKRSKEKRKQALIDDIVSRNISIDDLEIIAVTYDTESQSASANDEESGGDSGESSDTTPRLVDLGNGVVVQLSPASGKGGSTFHLGPIAQALGGWNIDEYLLLDIMIFNKQIEIGLAEQGIFGVGLRF